MELLLWYNIIIISSSSSSSSSLVSVVIKEEPTSETCSTHGNSKSKSYMKEFRVD